MDSFVVHVAVSVSDPVAEACRRAKRVRGRGFDEPAIGKNIEARRGVGRGGVGSIHRAASRHVQANVAVADLGEGIEEHVQYLSSG